MHNILIFADGRGHLRFNPRHCGMLWQATAAWNVVHNVSRSSAFDYLKQRYRIGGTYIALIFADSRGHARSKPQRAAAIHGQRRE